MEDYWTLTETAKSLGMSLKEASRVLDRAGLKPVTHQGRKCYRRSDLMEWLTREFGSLAAERLAAAEHSNAETLGLNPLELTVHDKLYGHVIFPERVGTASSMLRTMAAEACRTGRIFDEKKLLEQLVARERTSPTALRCGVALIHPLDVSSIYMEQGLLMLFKPPHPLPFGEPSGELTGLFFLLAFPEANEHLHILARLSRMLKDRSFIEDMLDADDPAQMLQVIKARERRIVERF